MPRSKVAAFIGSKHPNAKLDEIKVRAIKLLLKEGYKQLEIAKKFNISHSTIKSIAQGLSWRHVEVS